MQPQQDLHQPVGDQFVQREQFAVGSGNGFYIPRVTDFSAGLQRRWPPG